MIRFLLAGILRDKSRSLLPILVVSIGTMLTITLYCWLGGIMGESIELNARINTGHLKVMTRAYAANAEQLPNDLAMLNADSIIRILQIQFPGEDWVERIRFGGMIDFPDSSGETRAQGPVAGWAIDLLHPEKGEAARFNLKESLVEGKVPSKPGEALISYDFAQKFGVKTGDSFTLFGTTMDGNMAFKNFRVAGMVQFGASVLDRGAIITDLSDAQQAFDMEDAAGEILGFIRGNTYDSETATTIQHRFNKLFQDSKDEYTPEMVRLEDQGGMADMLVYSKTIGTMMVFIFVLAMSVVLWNAGLLGGLRRYREFGVRLAMGEEKKHIYTTLIYEGILTGALGSILGTILGLSLSYYLQEVGFSLGSMMKNASIMMPSVARAHISTGAFYIGFIPGLLSTVLGNALAGIGIYQRKTAQLFKELEV